MSRPCWRKPRSPRGAGNKPGRGRSGWLSACAKSGGDQLGVEAFLHEYSLSTREGIMLMCLAEALLRIPDAQTRDRLIRDKLGLGDWARHLGHSDSLFVNASTWGLMLTGRFVRVDLDAGRRSRHPLRPPRATARRAGRAAGRSCRRCGCSGATSSSARRSRRRSSARARPSRRAIATPTTCWARPRAPWPTPSATSAPIATRSRRSSTRRAATS